MLDTSSLIANYTPQNFSNSKYITSHQYINRTNINYRFQNSTRCPKNSFVISLLIKYSKIKNTQVCIIKIDIIHHM